LYCSRCDRSFDQRICANGHVNGHHAEACGTCGSLRLSTPAPVRGGVGTLALWIVWVAVGVAVALPAFTLSIGLVVPLDWPRIGPHLLLLTVMPWVIYRATLILRGPITKAWRPRLKPTVDA
jgi:hypothetical protein